MLLMMSLSSCNSYQVLCDTYLGDGRCRCRCLDLDTLKETDKVNCKKDWDKYFNGIPEEHPVNYGLEACDGIAGFKIEEIAKDLIPLIREERATCEDRRDNNADTF